MENLRESTHMVSIPLNDYEELIRKSERLDQALLYIYRAKYGLEKSELKSILFGVDAPEEEEHE